jgi:formate C-acetyltransferase
MSQHQVPMPECFGPTERIKQALDRFVATAPEICPERAVLITE